MAVPTAGRAAALAAGAVVLALAVTACGPDGSGSDGAKPAASTSTSGSGNGGSAEPAAPEAPDPAVLSALPAKLEADGTTITVGDATATNTVRVYEDPRCPICKRFEAAAGPRLAVLAKQGKVKIQYTLASFLDGNLGGDGSKKAANALRAALQQGRFVPFHERIYANQPEEHEDGFTEEFLLELAGRVPGLRGVAFDSAVKAMTYRGFVAKSEDAFIASGAQGTPTVKINGKQVSADDLQKLFDANAFAGLLKSNGVG